MFGSNLKFRSEFIARDGNLQHSAKYFIILNRNKVSLRDVDGKIAIERKAFIKANGSFQNSLSVKQEVVSVKPKHAS